MHRIIPLLVLSLAVAEEAPVVAPFLDGADAAVSFTFDDGHAAHARDLAPLLTARRFAATFYVVPSWVPETRQDGPKAKGSWEEWTALAAAGHEVGNHGMTHGDLRKITDPVALEREIVGAADMITTKVGVAPLSFAYAFCKESPEGKALVLARHVAGRGYFPLYEGAFPAEKANAMAEDAAAKKTWLVHLSHGVDPACFAAHLDWLAERRERFWVAPFGHVARYRAARDKAVVTASDAADGGLSIVVSLPPDQPRLAGPLTVILPTRPGTPVLTAPTTADLPRLRRVGETTLLTLMPGATPVVVVWRP